MPISIQTAPCRSSIASITQSTSFGKYEKLKGIAVKPPATVERFDRRTGKIYRSLRFFTRAVLGSYRDGFYRGRRKVLPVNMEELLDPMALAVWFMDDGGRGARTPRGLVINTSGF